MRTFSKSLKYDDDRALVPTGMEGRRLLKKFLKRCLQAYEHQVVANMQAIDLDDQQVEFG